MLRQGNGFSETAWLVWLSGTGCDGCTQALLGAADPSLEDLLLGVIPDAPRLALLHPLFGPHFNSQFKSSSRSSRASGALNPIFDASWQPGERYEGLLRRAARGELTPFIVVTDGAFYAPPLIGSFAQLGTDRTGQPLTASDWLSLLAPRAEAVLAVGSCASFGGLPAAVGSDDSGVVQSAAQLLGREFKSRAGLPLLRVPGCAPAGEGVVETLVSVFLHLAQLVPLELDEWQRPRWLYSKATSPAPPRANYAQAADFDAARQMSVLCGVPALGWTRGLGGCTRVGGACIACTETDFGDQFLPLARADAALAGPSG